MSDHYRSVPQDLPGQIGVPAKIVRDQLAALHRAKVAAMRDKDEEHADNLEHQITHLENYLKWNARRMREQEAGVSNSDETSSTGTWSFF